MRPVLSQGLNLGLEDAATLGYVLSHVKSPTQLTRATALYDHLRTSRVKRVLEETKSCENKSTFADSDAEMRPDDETVQSSDHNIDW
jgi:2-polyprenyl-6-methoxyphenol hydroxylase-like FAD-dependent oxidoreductase